MPNKASRSKSAATTTVHSLPGTVLLTRRQHFCSAHRLHNPEFSAEWNKKTFGPCNNPHWHGHNYVLEVTVRGQAHPDTGYVIELGELKRIMMRHVIDKCDHRNLNEEVDFLRGLIPSAENLVIAFWREIAPRLKHCRLHGVRLYETENSYAEYYGPAAASLSGNGAPPRS